MLKDQLAARVREKDLEGDALIGRVKSPNTIVLQMIDNCNLKCYMCFRQNGVYAPHPFFKKPISREMFKQLVKGVDFRRLSTVCLGGSGEVLLHPDVIYFMDYINERGQGSIHHQWFPVAPEIGAKIG
jgi:MoaA/NifB/PqqE/SkfB family radical SAM enzyme